MTMLDPIAMPFGPSEWLPCDEMHFSANLGTLAPLENVSKFSANDLDDLDWRANAIALGWHTEAETQQNIMALARAVPKLTAELRRLRGA